MKTRIVNIRKEKYDVFCGRPSIFGNPFRIGRDGSREDVVKKYRKYFYKKIQNDEKFRKAVRKLKGKMLGCYCAPKLCHVEIIADFLMKEHLYP